MSYAEPGQAWTYDDGPMDALDGGSEPRDIKADAPLQFAALHAQSQPQDGQVALSQLGSLLERASLPNDKSAQILELCADPASELVSERRFYTALAHAAALQADADHAVGGPLPSPIPELAIAEPDVAAAVKSAGLSQAPGSTLGASADAEYRPTGDRHLRVAVLTPNAGSFFAKHAVYSVDGTFGGKPVRVIRRYRDFALLASLLTRKYAFRAVPAIPPKRLAMNGRFLVGEPQDAFLSRRAAGLMRFVNLVVQHPVLAHDGLVSVFLLVETPFEQKMLDPGLVGTDELAGHTASALFISQWNPQRLDTWRATETAATDASAQISSLCRAVERQAQRFEAEQRDAEVLGRNFTALSRFLAPLYADMPDEQAELQQRLEQVAQFADTRQEQLKSDRTLLLHDLLEELKRYRDMLESVTALLARVKKLGGNTIPEQEKRIAAARRKLVAQSTPENAKEEDLHKLRQTIQQAQTSIRDQTNRDWLIKMVVTQELRTVQTMQYQISTILRSLAAVYAEHSTNLADSVTQLVDSAGTAPLPPP